MIYPRSFPGEAYRPLSGNYRKELFLRMVEGNCKSSYLRTLSVFIIFDVFQLKDMEKACAEFYYISNFREWGLDLPMKEK